MERSFLLECHCPDPDSVGVRRIDSDFSQETACIAVILSGSASINRWQETGGALGWNAEWSEPRCVNSVSVARYRSWIACGSASKGDVVNRKLLVSEMTVQMAQASAVCRSLSWLEGCCCCTVLLAAINAACSVA